MRLRTASIQHRHLVPRCLDCGREQDARRTPETCTGCGADLQDRPPRSYAEMEGLVELELPACQPDPFVRWRQRVTLERWILVAFVGCVTTAFLLHAVGSMLS
jgi:hypothetical protein